jgi:Protein of unknown function (DUF3563)
MKFIMKFFNDLAKSDERRELEREEAYLAKSVDIHDLEYRMGELEREKKVFPWVAFTRQ